MLRRTFVAALGAGVAAPALADAWPSRQVKVVIPYPPGGPTDVSIRIVMEKVGRLLGQPILFDNRGGASGMIGAEYAKTQPADGYTFLGNTIAMMAITRHLQPIPFDPDKAWDEREQQYKMSGEIVKTKPYVQTAEGDKTGLWTSVISAVVFILERSSMAEKPGAGVGRSDKNGGEAPANGLNGGPATHP